MSQGYIVCDILQRPLRMRESDVYVSLRRLTISIQKPLTFMRAVTRCFDRIDHDH